MRTCISSSPYFDHPALIAPPLSPPCILIRAETELGLTGPDIKPGGTYTFWVRAMGQGESRGSFASKAVCST